MATLKQRVQISSSRRSVVVVEQEFNEMGIAQGEPRVGTIQFDPGVTTVQKVYDYAKTRRWELAGDPNRLGFYTPVDLGPLPEGAASESRHGSQNAFSAGQTQVSSREIRTEQ